MVDDDEDLPPLVSQAAVHAAPVTFIGGRAGGSEKGTVLALIVFATGWTALRSFSRPAGRGGLPDVARPPDVE